MDIDFPWISVEQNIINCPDGHRVRLHAYSLSPELAPQIAVLGGLLSAEECGELIALSQPRLHPAETAGAERATFAPTENSLIARIDARIAALAQWSVDDARGLQVTRYREGAELTPRRDRDEDDAGYDTVGSTRRRIATVIMYLNDCRNSGAISFPGTGLSVCPHRGNALFFNYPDIGRDVSADRCLYGGLPPASGEKWTATKWLTRRLN